MARPMTDHKPRYVTRWHGVTTANGSIMRTAEIVELPPETPFERAMVEFYTRPRPNTESYDRHHFTAATRTPAPNAAAPDTPPPEPPPA